MATSSKDRAFDNTLLSPDDGRLGIAVREIEELNG